MTSLAKKAVKKRLTPTPFISRGWCGIRAIPTGYFYTTKRDGTWWVIDPAGNAFFILGTDHVNYRVHDCEALGYAPYHRNCRAIHGAESKWAASATQRLLSWGFNTLGANNSPSTRGRGLTHVEFISLGASYARLDSIPQRTWWTGFPNVFNPAFADHCDRLARELCPQHRRDQSLLGYFLDNELEWHGGINNVGGSLLCDALARPGDNPAHRAAFKLLKSRYPRESVSAFNLAWGMKLKSLKDLAAPITVRAQTPAAKEDSRLFARLCAKEYFRIATAAVRRHDPNHMILGNRFAGNPGDVWDIAGQFCDIVSVNCYRKLDLASGKFTDNFEADLRRWYDRAKRPLFITEWSFPALDTDRPCNSGAGQRVPTQHERARAFQVFQQTLLRTPFVVGSDYFMWVDEPKLGISKSFPEDSNYGLVNEHDEPYELLVETATFTNALAYVTRSGCDGRRIFLRATPETQEPDFNAGATLALTIDNQLDRDFTGTMRLQLSDGKRTKKTPPFAASAPAGQSHTIQVPARFPGNFSRLTILPICDAPGTYPLQYRYVNRLRLHPLISNHGPHASEVIPWFKRGAPIHITHAGKTLLRGSFRLVGDNLLFRWHITDGDVLVNPNVPFNGSCTEIFFRGTAANASTRQFFLTPADKPSIVNAQYLPVPEAHAQIERDAKGYWAQGAIPLAPLNIAPGKEPFYFDLIVRSGLFAGVRDVRVGWNGQTDSWQNSAHFSVVHAAPEP